MSWIVYAVLAAALVVWLETRRSGRVRLRQLELGVDCPALSGSGLKILHISDTHLSPSTGDRLRAVQRMAGRTWDLVFLTGDFVDDPQSTGPLIQALAALSARYGKFAVLGNHDYYRYRAGNPWRWFRILVGSLTHERCDRLGDRLDTGALVTALRGAGVQVLFNELGEVRLDDGLLLQVFGIDDPSTNRDNPRRLYGMVRQDSLRLVLTHSPRRIQLLHPLSPHLVLCGHTHGGQVRLPFVGALSTGSDAPRRAASGLVGMAGFRVHISPGAGAGSVFPWRFLAPAEITAVHLMQPGQVRAFEASDVYIQNAKP